MMNLSVIYDTAWMPYPFKTFWQWLQVPEEDALAKFLHMLKEYLKCVEKVLEVFKSKEKVYKNYEGFNL